MESKVTEKLESADRSILQMLNTLNNLRATLVDSRMEIKHLKKELRRSRREIGRLLSKKVAYEGQDALIGTSFIQKSKQSIWVAQKRVAKAIRKAAKALCADSPADHEAALWGVLKYLWPEAHQADSSAALKRLLYQDNGDPSDGPERAAAELFGTMRKNTNMEDHHILMGTVLEVWQIKNNMAICRDCGETLHYTSADLNVEHHSDCRYVEIGRFNPWPLYHRALAAMLRAKEEERLDREANRLAHELISNAKPNDVLLINCPIEGISLQFQPYRDGEWEDVTVNVSGYDWDTLEEAFEAGVRLAEDQGGRLIYVPRKGRPRIIDPAKRRKKQESRE